MQSNLRSRASTLARLAVAASLLTLGAGAQASLEWSATQPDSSGDEYTPTLTVGPDGSVYLAHTIDNTSASNRNVRLLKFSSGGSFAWLSEWDTYGFHDSVTAMLTAPNGDLFVAGSDRRETAIGHINHDATLRKFSPGGTQQWFAASQGFGGTAVTFYALARLSNGSVIAAGYKGGGGHLVRFSDAGAIEWQRTIAGGLGGTVLGDIVVLADDSIVACGRRGTNFNGALTVWRFDADGNELWRSMLDELVEQQSQGSSLCITPLGRVVVGGSRKDPALDADMALAQFDPSDGSLDWKLYVSANSGPSGMDEIRKVAATPDGVIWCAGRRFDTQSDMDTVILRVDGGGALLSLETWAGGAASYDQPQSLHVGSAGQTWVSVLGSGLSNRDITVLQFDSAGGLSSQDVFDLGGDDIAFVAAAGPGEQLTIAGATNASGDYDVLALRIELGDAPSGFCTAKVNSLGCTPLMSFAGASSANSASGFELLCTQVRNQKSGLLVYSLAGPAATPFQGGYLCVAAPRRRTPVTSSGGSTSGDDCSGVFALDLNAFAAGSLGGTPAPELSVAGTSVYCQQWSRDSGSIAGSGLSSGLRYVVGP